MQSRWMAAIGCGVFIGSAALGWSADPPAEGQPGGPLSPQATLKTLVVADGLVVELVAAEPEIVDPVAIHFAADGSLYVVEMRDYPYGPKPGEPPSSQIKRLIDKDGDGRFEAATVFADQLLFPTGLVPYRDGFVVTLAGQIIFLADRDGDGRAEFKEVWFSGFAQENSQLRANHPTYGPDGFIYVANGLRGGKIVAERPEWKKSNEPLVITGFDFRFHPDTGEFGTVTGHGQFGLTFDDFGRRFVCSNRNPCQHVVFEDAYLKLNPKFGVKAVMHDVCAPAERSRLYPISRTFTTSAQHTNQFTAACGVLIYRGDGLPNDYYNSVFTCDPTGNLVHHEFLVPDGPTFAGKVRDVGKEFLASTDTWFRPVNLAHGPDGALYVVDMYRAVIEHPDWMPPELKSRGDVRWGDDRGRIWRVKSRESRVKRREPEKTDLVGQLRILNVWQRDVARRALIENPDPKQEDALNSLIKNGASLEKIEALAVLQAWRALKLEHLSFSIEPLDRWSDARVAAYRYSELVANFDQLGEIAFAARGNIKRASPAEHFQIILTSMHFGKKSALEILIEIARQSELDYWTRSALILASRGEADQLLAAAFDDPRLTNNKPLPAGFAHYIEELAAISVDVADIQSARKLDAIPIDRTELPSTRTLQWAYLRGRGAGLAKSGGRMDVTRSIADEDCIAAMKAWMADADQTATDSQAAVESRLTAMQTLRYAGADLAVPALLVISEESDATLAATALDTLAVFDQADFAPVLMERFPRSAPAIRRAILDVMLSSPERVPLLLSALESGDIKPGELDPTRQARLVNHRVPDIKQRAAKLFANASADRDAVIKQYEPALAQKPDPKRGRLVFEKQCVTCHRVDNLGVNVGPDISDTYNKTPAMLLLAILDPNRAVDNNSFAYTVTTADGKTLTGLLAAENSSSVTLRQPEGKNETILRSDIDELRSTGLSLMPVGFEKNVTPEQMADLIAFL
ncbi:MAG TPA: PVC-type heme-binding CxxCH protein, partial [Planctomycetaceae bacterium]|nr:PVC-type heme-binding CxxCH protein [Planctomycetaceae bacterium]